MHFSNCGERKTNEINFIGLSFTIIVIYLSSAPTVLEALYYWLIPAYSGGISSPFDRHI
jgi:hypothetical protein